ncbi:MAG: sulfite exporter TauE/SafE family protein [Pseudomonadales bacterium]|nr:sulfite exporter TauE/SafE family protein [Pseudomonadales bacterium]
MLEFNTILFLLLVTLGAFIQTLTGFAMGVVIIVGATLLDLQAIALSAAIISLISLVNTMVAMRKNYKHVDTDYFRWLCFWLMPGLVAGVALLAYLSKNHYDILCMLLGALVIAAGILLIRKPPPYRERSTQAQAASFGLLGGVFGGLFSAGGSAFGYFLYRQPIEVSVARATLLAVLLISTVIRTIMISLEGQITTEVLLTALIAFPIVVVVTEVTGRYLSFFSDVVVRKIVVALMMIAGLFLLFNSIVISIKELKTVAGV